MFHYRWARPLVLLSEDWRVALLVALPVVLLDVWVAAMLVAASDAEWGPLYRETSVRLSANRSLRELLELPIRRYLVPHLCRATRYVRAFLRLRVCPRRLKLRLIRM